VRAPFHLDPREINASRLESIFDAPEPLTVGAEEEVMLLEPETLDLWPHATELLRRLGTDRRFKPELPASQVEIIAGPAASVTEILAALSAGRRDLAQAAEGLVLPAAAGVHPFAEAEGELAPSERYDHLHAEYGPIARRQLVASLQVHVAVGSAERSLYLYNVLRGYLPEIAALAANAAVYEGRDTGMASIRPKIAEILPRQGIPPAIESWERFAEELRWGASAGAVPEPRRWWWELRPNPAFGTLEIRAPDAQTTLADAAGVVAFLQALVGWLSERHDDGERMRPAPTWRIEENRWSAARYGVEGRMADLETGEQQPTRERLGRLLDRLEPISERLGSKRLLEDARRMVDFNGAIRQRELYRREGAAGLAAWLGRHFLDGEGGGAAVLPADQRG
jgi:carboxylate-amine ligase